MLKTKKRTRFRKMNKIFLRKKKQLLFNRTVEVRNNLTRIPTSTL